MKKIRVQVFCKVCGAGFEVRPCEVKAYATCSKPCSFIYRSMNATGRVVTWGAKAAASRKANPKPENRDYLTDEYRKKRSELAIASGLGRSNKGKKLTADHRAKMSLAHTGHSRGGWKMSNEIKAGRKSRAPKGAMASAWKGGITPINAAIRTSTEYKEWRQKVFERDDYTCQFCGARGVKLHTDHMKPFAHYKELRTEITNGRTLCIPCHEQTPTYKGRRHLMKSVHGIDILET